MYIYIAHRISVGIILLIYCNLSVQCLDILCGPWRHENQNPIWRWQRIFKWAETDIILLMGVAFGTNHR